MKIMALARKEARDILTNRIYLLVVVVQVFIVLGAFGLGYVSSVANDPDLLDQWKFSSSLKVGVSEELKGSDFAQALEEKNLNLIYYRNISEARNLVGTQLIAVVEVSPPPKEDISVEIDNANIFFPVVSQKINDAINKYNLEKKLKAGGLSKTDIQKIENPLVLNEKNVNKENEVKLALDNSYFVEIMYGFIVPFILLLPFFLASNIVTDSIVGERERKTFEVLLMTPLSGSMVIIGKIIPILSFSLIQSIAWIVLLDLLKVPIFNPFLLLILLFFVGLGFIGAGVLISMFVDSTKEANSAITLFLVFVTFIFFLPLFIKLPFLQGILNIIPTILMVKLSSTPNIQPYIILYFMPSITLSIMIFTFTVKYFNHERTIRL
ncbi:MAG: ABC transporter permease [Euryarchaeota archaeon]|nr:ABC transporter permease [Euryarchaeota archaeon]